ncbi:MAG: hypothetical protein HLUCCA11_10830 [Phormidesmis priestleyi Ana]|uniref:PEP-CTERM protein-sorting domain n=1 Tax=Phormidesmis priestleyi Ana TaxID=1666911 RepID=A0A0P7YWS4_9CYAN|nr:MAG: hypothetical protein HLUCCA11_10830 [Phormidesmis priestleyi Ana]
MFQPTNIVSAALAAVFVLVLSPNQRLQAATLFTGSSNGIFGTPIIDASVDSEALFSIERAGPRTESFLVGEPGVGSMPNQLTFSGQSFSVMPEQTFAIGNFFYHNGQTFSGTNVSAVPISVSLNFHQPTQAQQQFEYRFTFGLTPNIATSSSADSLTISQNPAPQAFALNQSNYPENYSVEVLGFSLDQGATFTRNFQIPEDRSINSTLFARIQKNSTAYDLTKPSSSSPVSIPEPALLTGLLLLGSTTFLSKLSKKFTLPLSH